jgi:hypothetical protein
MLSLARRVVDARTSVESADPDAALAGEIDPLLEAAKPAGQGV